MNQLHTSTDLFLQIHQKGKLYPYPHLCMPFIWSIQQNFPKAETKISSKENFAFFACVGNSEREFRDLLRHSL